MFVVTHEAPAESPEGSVHHFVTDGIESALELANDVSGDKDIAVMGGASIGRRFIEARLADEKYRHAGSTAS